MRKKFNADERRAYTAGELARFTQQYARKAYSTHDPNDRGYDRRLEERVKRMDPSELSTLLSDDE